ncbi:hypothetical protein CEXT_141951 [Caerostris extrusa]|uniref:Uncharacterized protein n=1 Tax=Caerostris extrusa TaxID=172846 RepID=A0AAV4QP72_CAEEX|nr:hypothetical protein CEXT_141951 [Caerostris extrusa]
MEGERKAPPLGTPAPRRGAPHKSAITSPRPSRSPVTPPNKGGAPIPNGNSFRRRWGRGSLADLSHSMPIVPHNGRPILSQSDFLSKSVSVVLKVLSLRFCKRQQGP